MYEVYQSINSKMENCEKILSFNMIGVSQVHYIGLRYNDVQ